MTPGNALASAASTTKHPASLGIIPNQKLTGSTSALPYGRFTAPTITAAPKTTNAGCQCPPSSPNSLRILYHVFRCSADTSHLADADSCILPPYLTSYLQHNRETTSLCSGYHFQPPMYNVTSLYPALRPRLLSRSTIPILAPQVKSLFESQK